jgi:DNA-binding response OmpR family regulator
MLPQVPKIGESFCVLVVEDDIAIAHMVETALLDAGFACHLVPDGRSALEAFEQIKPQLVILDIMMPGMDGYQVCAAIRQSSLVPILVLTALDTEADQIEAFQSGAGSYVCKPFTAQLLMKRITSLLQRVYHDDATADEGTAASGAPQLPRLRLLRP